MGRIVREQLIPAPAAQVWPLVDDPAGMAQWFAFADRMELIEGTGLGRRQRLYGHWGSKRSEIDQQIIAYDPPTRLAWRHEAERLDGKPAPKFAAETVFTIELLPSNNATLVRLSSAQRPAGLFQGLVMRAFGTREIAKLLDQSLNALAHRFTSTS
jgi:uncharacterized protein YndB with AHSA1/START domain